MLQLPRDVLLHLFLFLNLDDWCHYRQLSRKHAQSTQRLGGFVQGVVRDRMLRFLMNLLGEVTYSKFLIALSTSNAAVSGSVFLELLLGSDQFVCGDLDVFVPLFLGSFSDVHKCMYEDITGREWGNKPTGDELRRIQAFSSFHASNWVFEHVQGITASQYRNSTFTVDTDPWISQLWNYLPRNGVRSVQVIGIRSIKYRKLQKRKANYGLANYFIDQSFDFTCCLGKMFVQQLDDGSFTTQFILPPVADMHRRMLVTRPVFEQRMAFVSERVLKRYRNYRVKKYEDRGFRLQGKLSHLGRNYSKVHKLKLDKDRKYTLDQVNLMCDGRRKPRKRRKVTHSSK